MNSVAESLVGIPYDPIWNNCATLVCRYYRDIGYGDLPDGDLSEYTPKALLWIKNNFNKISTLEQHCLVVVKNCDGSLHVGVFDGEKVLHNSPVFGSSIRQNLQVFLLQHNNKKNMRIYKWRH